MTSASRSDEYLATKQVLSESISFNLTIQWALSKQMSRIFCAEAGPAIKSSAKFLSFAVRYCIASSFLEIFLRLFTLLLVAITINLVSLESNPRAYRNVSLSWSLAAACYYALWVLDLIGLVNWVYFTSLDRKLFEFRSVIEFYFDETLSFKKWALVSTKEFLDSCDLKLSCCIVPRRFPSRLSSSAMFAFCFKLTLSWLLTPDFELWSSFSLF